MKKSLCIILALLMIISFASCAKNTKDPPKEAVEKLDIADGYTIVISETATNVVKSLSNDLVNAIKDKTNIKLERVTDNTEKSKVVEKEILVGVSGREETKTALEKLAITGYSISFSGEKLVIVASNDFMLEKAVGEFINSHLSFDGKEANIVKDLNVTYDGSADMFPLLDEEGMFKYQIIYPNENENGERELAEKIRLQIQKTFNCKISLIRYDISVKADDDSFELLVGKTNRSQSQGLYEKMGDFNVKTVIDGNKILIGSSLPSDLGREVDNFCNYISESAKGTYDGKYMMQNGYSHNAKVYDWLDNVSMMDTGTFRGVFDEGDEAMVFVWEDVNQSNYDAYLTELKTNGFVEKQTYTLGDNRYMFLESNMAHAYVCYISNKEMVRLMVDNKEKGTLYPTATQASYSAVEGYQPKLWQVECDWKTALSWDTTLPEQWRGANAGMCYILQVADGSFIIIDGGMNSSKQAEIIYNHLKANSIDEKPVVSGWFITHDHADHTGGLQQFTKLYRDKVTVRAFYHNIPARGFGQEESSVGDAKIVSLMKQYSGAAIYRKLHTGMNFYIADARIDVMYTHEDLYPVNTKDFNESSTVIRITLGNQRIMFLADVQDEGGKVMIDTMPKYEMKCDIVQYAHHGWDGPTKELYDLIEAPTVLWPVSIYSWQKGAEAENIFDRLINKNSGAYFYEVNHYIAYDAKYVKTIIVNAEGTGTQELVLPYTPRDQRLPDYKAIYESIKARET